MPEPKELRRSITLPFLILYGVGTMVGAGFYALMGKVTGEAGMLAPVALLLAGTFALMTGLSYAELVSRFPVSAGEVRYVDQGFNKAFAAKITGGLVVLTGVVSAAVLSVATVGFLRDLVDVPEALAIVVLLIVMGGVASWGITQSVGLVATITLIEVGALIYATIVTEAGLGDLVGNWDRFVPPLEGDVWIGLFAGAFLAFYAFIGFEDMVNIAEEVRNARRAVPIAVVVTVVVTIVLYVTVAGIAVLSVPSEALAASNTPVAEMVRGHGWYSTTGIGIVSLLAGINGALVQIIMASRVLYGMAGRGHVPAWFGTVDRKTRTPMRSTIAVVVVVLVLALSFPLTMLARITAGIILVVFGLVNLALWRIKRRDPDPHGEGPRLPIWLPPMAAAACALVLAFQLWLML